MKKVKFIFISFLLIILMAGCKTIKQKNDEIIENLRIAVRPLNKEDIKNRKLPNQTSGLVITKIAKHKKKEK